MYRTKRLCLQGVVVVKFFVDFFRCKRLEGNDRQTVDGNSSIKCQNTFFGEHTTYLALRE